jgi:hypothetical protein
MKKRKELSLTEKAVKALTDAVAKVVEDHRQRGKPLAVWRDGQVVWLSPEELGKIHEQPVPYRTKPRRPKS